MIDPRIEAGVKLVPEFYIKKPIPIKAYKFDPARKADYIVNLEYADGGKGVDCKWGIQTLEGMHEVKIGDWIITGVRGERYPIKGDIFEETYEPALTAAGELSGRNIVPVQTLLDLLNPLHGSLDLQINDERLREEYTPPDREWEVTITDKMERDLTKAVLILEGKVPASPSVGEDVVKVARAIFFEQCNIMHDHEECWKKAHQDVWKDTTRAAIAALGRT